MSKEEEGDSFPFRSTRGVRLFSFPSGVYIHLIPSCHWEDSEKENSVLCHLVACLVLLFLISSPLLMLFQGNATEDKACSHSFSIQVHYKRLLRRKGRKEDAEAPASERKQIKRRKRYRIEKERILEKLEIRYTCPAIQYTWIDILPCADA